MALKLEEKKTIVAEVAEVAASSVSAVAADYRGLTVAEMTNLRTKARQNGIYMKIVRNTLARRALEGTEFACMDEALVGPLFLAFSREDPAAAARLLHEICKESEKLKVVAIVLGGKLFGAESLEAIAKMPTKEQALSMLMSVIQAPAGKLVRTLAETYTKLVRSVAAVRDIKQQG